MIANYILFVNVYMEQIKVNLQHKDRLFRFIFENEKYKHFNIKSQT